ncbi:hypothetical protein Hanom_Chr08g00747751 [Helianthus anomalus]
MMLGRLSRNARPVMRETNGEDALLWRMFCPDFKGKAEILTCDEGDLGALGDPTATGVPKQTHEAVVVPPWVPEVAGTPRTRLRKYDNCIVVSDTLEGLGVPGGSAAVGGSSAGSKPVDDKKRKGDAPVAGGQKAP